MTEEELELYLSKIVECRNCKNMIELDEEATRGTVAECKCGCTMKCLDKDEFISRWRVVNPFSFEDKRE